MADARATAALLGCLIDRAKAKCLDILQARRDVLDQVAQYLLENETMDAETFQTFFQDEA